MLGGVFRALRLLHEGSTGRLSSPSRDEGELLSGFAAALLPSSSERSLGLVDASRVVILQDRDSGRRIFQVTGSEGKSYLVLPHFCQCRYYSEVVLQAKTDVTCKHEVACVIAASTPGYRNVLILEKADFDEKLLAACLDSL